MLLRWEIFQRKTQSNKSPWTQSPIERYVLSPSASVSHYTDTVPGNFRPRAPEHFPSRILAKFVAQWETLILHFSLLFLLLLYHVRKNVEHPDGSKSIVYSCSRECHEFYWQWSLYWLFLLILWCAWTPLDDSGEQTAVFSFQSLSSLQGICAEDSQTWTRTCNQFYCGQTSLSDPNSFSPVILVIFAAEWFSSLARSNLK